MTMTRTRLSLALFLAALLIPALSVSADDANLVDNGGFESGLSGWMYKQWKQMKAPGHVHRNEAPEGKAYFRITDETDGTSGWLAKEVKYGDIEGDQALSMQIRCMNVSAGPLRVRVLLDKAGWAGKQGQENVIVTSGTHDWQRFVVPLPAEQLRKSPTQKLTIFVYRLPAGQAGIDDIRIVPMTDELKDLAATTQDAVKDNQKAAIQADADADGNYVKNGGFEDGVSGWMYHQWVGKKEPGVIDATDFKEGKASFKFALPDATGGRNMAKEVTLADPSQGHVLTVWLKTQDLPHNSVRLRVGVKGKGWIGSRMGKPNQLVLGGTLDWKQYGVFIPANELRGVNQLTVFIYRDDMSEGALWIDDLRIKPGTREDVPAGSKPLTLKADTSHPDTSTFKIGDPVQLRFKVNGLTEGQELSLSVRIVDEHDKDLAKHELPVVGDENGKWSGSLDAPRERLGFYRVYGELSNGILIDGVGSRVPGFLTYAVVPDPAERKLYSEEETYFGMQGGFNGRWRTEICRYLGIRWALDDSLQWKRCEPKKAGQFDADAAIEKLKPHTHDNASWVTYPLPTLFGAPKWAVKPETFSYMTGALTPEGEKAWEDFVRKAAKVFMYKYPDLETHIYQITWEPVRPWGYKGTDEQLVKIYEIAYRVLHEVDPQAVVAGPAQGIKGHELKAFSNLCKAGLDKYLDAYTVHPYFQIPSEPDGLVERVRNLKATIRQSTGKDLPMFGTEQGQSTHENPGEELGHARGLMRQNLIMMGEGFRFNILFYIVDYRLAGQTGYGYYYSLVPGVGWGPGKIGPKVIAPALAAQSWLLEGHTSTGAIEWLGETAWGYAFQRDQSIVLALWDFGGPQRDVTIPVAAETVTIHDWMGNARQVPTDKGSLTVTIGPEPIYITGGSPAIWGSGSKMIRVAERDVTACPGETKTLDVSITSPADGPDQLTLRFQADERLGMDPVTQTLPAKGTDARTFSYRVPIPASAELGRYPLRLLLSDGEKDIAASGLMLTVVSPANVVDISPSETETGQMGVALTIKDQRGTGVAGTVELQLDGAKNTQAAAEFNIAAGQTETIVAAFANAELDAAKVYGFKANVETSTGITTTRSGKINFLKAPRQAPTIDADLSDWSDIPAVAIGESRDVIRGKRDRNGPKDLSADLRYAWDAEALYIAVDVTDDVFRQEEHGANTWRHDCVQLAFNLDPKQRKQSTGNLLDDAGNARRYTELNVAKTSNGVELCRSISFDQNKLASGIVSPETIKAAVVTEGNRIVYEIAIPWSQLGADTPPDSQSVIGVAAAVNDNDAASQKWPSGIGLFRGIEPKDPDKFGLLLLGR